MSSHFACTMCGRCCRDLRIPLGLAEALDWLRDGGDVQILCEAIPWLVEPGADDLHAAYKFERSSPAVSGTLPVRVIVLVVAAFDGPCPNLQPDFRCGAYDRRPRVCRIYPAEINPFIALQPAAKGCPPEAWDERHPVLEVSGRYLDPALAADSAAFRDTDIREVEARRKLCGLLGVHTAALANEGFVVVSPGREVLMRAIALAMDDAVADDAPATAWTLVSNRRRIRDALVSVDAVAASPETLPEQHVFLGFHAAED